jgi:hypothetical protein
MALVVAWLMLTLSLLGQTAGGNKVGAAAPKSAASKKWRTPWGDPDLQGSWTNATSTPLERPVKAAGRAKLTPEEIAADKSRKPRAVVGDGAAYEEEVWQDRGFSDGRTSLIYDPPDGRKPPLTAEGKRRQSGWNESIRTDGPTSEHPYNGPEDLDLSTRCIVRETLPHGLGYGMVFEIVQSPGFVAINQEEIHDTRVIPLDTRPHLPKNVEQWLGDPLGHWEGDTLVIETTNFNDRRRFEGSSKNLRLVERWTRIADGRIDYRFTMDDPVIWTKPWSASLTWTPSGPPFEYACHEDNIGMYSVILGARSADSKQAPKKP